jgi:hypothetical protein
MWWTFFVSFFDFDTHFLTAAYYVDVPFVQGEHYIALVYMGQGLMPAAPYSPNIAITICTLEIF